MALYHRKIKVEQKKKHTPILECIQLLQAHNMQKALSLSPSLSLSLDTLSEPAKTCLKLVSRGQDNHVSETFDLFSRWGSEWYVYGMVYDTKSPIPTTRNFEAENKRCEIFF